LSKKTRPLATRIIVGLALGGVFIFSLANPLLFLLLVVAAAALGAFELGNAMRKSGWHVPRFIAAICAAAIITAAYFYGATGQWLALVASVAAMVFWRVGFLVISKTKQSLKQTIRDFGASTFTLIYVPLLASFMALMINLERGTQLVFSMVLTVSMIDTAGFLVGRVIGKTKLAPGISPKKTFEGLVASAIAALLTGQVAAWLMEASIGWGVLFSAVILLSAVLGDLSESLIKRDLEVKDMGDVLPGHGGIMDRLDSILPSAFMAYLLSHVIF
jgi:phosphatidate cytidylyltransferase